MALKSGRRKFFDVYIDAGEVLTLLFPHDEAILLLLVIVAE